MSSFVKSIAGGVFLFFAVNIGQAETRPTFVADSVSLQEIHQEVESINSVSSLLIQQDGNLLTEKYFNGLQKGQATNIKSASKSIISLLAGIAIEKGYIESVDEPIATYFDDYFEANPDSEKESITIKDVLTMRTGLETTSFYNYGRWVSSNDWITYTLNQPLEKEPGGNMAYSTGTSHLLSVIITKATGMSTKEFAQKFLFGPLEISVGGWDRDPQGYYMGGNNMALAPADLVKIGQMILDGGSYNGRQIVSKDWVTESFKTYTRSNFNPYDYGYMWWNKPVGDYKVFFAWGFGGQYLYMIPELNAVVVLTGTLENADQSRSYKDPVFTLLREKIIPHLESGAPKTR
ncbi:MAG: serine hydrolase domain-containing protein [Bacteroidota bacterium]